MSTPAASSDDQAPDADSAPVGQVRTLLAAPGPTNGAPLSAEALAERYGLPLIDFRAESVQADAAESIPLHVLTRIRALAVPDRRRPA